MPGPDDVLGIEARLMEFISKKFDAMTAAARRFDQQGRGSFDKLSKKGSAVSRVMGDMRASLARAATQFGPAALAAIALTKAIHAVGEAIRFVQRVTEDFQKTMSRVRAIIEPTAKDFDLLSEKAKELGRTTTYTASQTANAFVELGKMGFKTTQILATANDVLNLAVVGEQGMTDAAILLTSTLKQFDMEATESTFVVDVMAKAYNSSALNATKLQESMKFVGTTASMANISFLKTTALLATLAERKIDASMAGTTLNRMLSMLVKPSSKINKELEKMGFHSTDVMEKIRFLSEANIDLGESFELFDIRAARAANVLLRSMPTYDKMLKLLKDNKGAAQKFADVLLDNVAGAQIKLKSAQEGLGIALGEAFSASKQKRIEFYTHLTTKAAAMVMAHRNELAGLGIIISTVLKGLGVLVYSIISAMVGVWNTVQMVINGAALAIVGSIRWIAKTLNWLSKKIRGKEVFDLTVLNNTVAAMERVTTDKAKKAWLALTGQNFKKEHADALKMIDALTKKKIEAMLPPEEARETDKEAKERLRKAKELVKAINELRVVAAAEGREREIIELNIWFDEKYKVVKESEEGLHLLRVAYKQRLFEIDKKYQDKMINNQKIWAQTMASIFKTVTDGISRSITMSFMALVTKQKDLGAQLRDMWKGILAQIVEMVMQAIVRMLVLKALTAGMFGGGTFATAIRSVFGLGKLQAGTPDWKGGMAIVGERGPELVNLPPGSRVHNNYETRNMMGGNTYIVNYHGRGGAEDDDALVEKLKRLEYQGKLGELKNAFQET